MPRKNYWTDSKSLWTSSNMVPSGWLLRVWKRLNAPKHRFERKVGCKDGWSRWNSVTNFRSMPRKNYWTVSKSIRVWWHRVPPSWLLRVWKHSDCSRLSISSNQLNQHPGRICSIWLLIVWIGWMWRPDSLFWTLKQCLASEQRNLTVSEPSTTFVGSILT